MKTNLEYRNLIGQRVAARTDLGVKSGGQRSGTIEQGTKGTIISDTSTADDDGSLRVRWDLDGSPTLRIKRQHYRRALIEIDA